EPARHRDRDGSGLRPLGQIQRGRLRVREGDGHRSIIGRFAFGLEDGVQVGPTRCR
ncbi:MAG: hypothetical protein JWM31_3654, partial [Solirubrobacterales bacterium]|nr:hypothetical protein [Solirubrobacterales bacterium]